MKKILFSLLISIPAIALGQRAESVTVDAPAGAGGIRFSSQKPVEVVLRVNKDTVFIEEKADINFIKIGDKLFKIERSIELKPLLENGFMYWPNGGTLNTRPWNFRVGN